ncbi:sugar phosphate isomerase/epimerase family protein [Marinomonas sp.]|uniref:sugar phosphate isomerase/epimerase family protein n=1 Tax=Marinomonas sp. TaxID=1904862 RepID=UPI003BAC5F06
MVDFNIGNIKFGVDLVTFSHPDYWGVKTDDEVGVKAKNQPNQFWSKMLDDVAATGVTGIELTFPPFDWRGATEAFGSVDLFKQELDKRGLILSSAFFSHFERHPNISDPIIRATLLDEATHYAEFLNECDADVLVVGCPLRRSLGQSPVEAFDFDKAKEIADFINELGIATYKQGVRLALHSEVSTVFAMPRDIQLLMMLTDPYYVHMCPDSAHLLLAGGRPADVIAQHKERIAISHWKDAKGLFPTDEVIDSSIHHKHRPYFCEFGKGEVAFKAWASVLLSKQENSWNILELDASENPVESIVHALKEVAGVIKRLD